MLPRSSAVQPQEQLLFVSQVSFETKNVTRLVDADEKMWSADFLKLRRTFSDFLGLLMLSMSFYGFLNFSKLF